MVKKQAIGFCAKCRRNITEEISTCTACKVNFHTGCAKIHTVIDPSGVSVPCEAACATRTADELQQMLSKLTIASDVCETNAVITEQVIETVSPRVQESGLGKGERVGKVAAFTNEAK